MVVAVLVMNSVLASIKLMFECGEELFDIRSDFNAAEKVFEIGRRAL
jgi:hypothetical protein